MQDVRHEVCCGVLLQPPPPVLPQGDRPPVQHLQQALQRQAVPHHAHEVQPRAGSHQRRAQVFGVQQKLPVQERQTFTPCEGTRIVLSFLLNTLFH